MTAECANALQPDDALTGEVMTNRVAAIRRHEEEADRHQAEADSHRWESARLIAGELESGKSQRRLAGEIGKSQSHVKLMSMLWREYLGTQNLPDFNEAYQRVKAAKPKPVGETPEPASTPERDPEANPPGESGPDGWVQTKPQDSPTPGEDEPPDKGGGCAVTDPLVHMAGFLNTSIKAWEEDPSAAKSVSAREKLKKHCKTILEMIEKLEQVE